MFRTINTSEQIPLATSVTSIAVPANTADSSNIGDPFGVDGGARIINGVMIVNSLVTAQYILGAFDRAPTATDHDIFIPPGRPMIFSVPITARDLQLLPSASAINAAVMWGSGH